MRDPAPPTSPAEAGARIHQLAADDWEVLRDLRLAALEDAPDAFWATLSVEAAYSREQWAGFLRSATWFVATRDGDRVGIVGVVTRPEAPEEAEVIGMWVAPGARRRGVGDELLTACDRWAQGQRVRALNLWLVAENHGARGLYIRHGYLPTGETMPLARDESKQEIRMRLQL